MMNGERLAYELMKPALNKLGIFFALLVSSTLFMGILKIFSVITFSWWIVMSPTLFLFVFLFVVVILMAGTEDI